MTPNAPSERISRRSNRGRTRALALLVVLGALAGGWLVLSDKTTPAGEATESGTVSVVAGDTEIQERSVTEVAAMTSQRLEHWVGEVPRVRKIRVDGADVTLRVDRALLEEQVATAASSGGGRVELPEEPVASRRTLPIVQQDLRNNCETAALSMLLTAEGVRVDQLELQEQLPQSGPLDPEPSDRGDLFVWGDPNIGYVGRADGGGTSGGYGVYEAPIQELAAQSGVDLADLDDTPRSVYRALLDGRPVMTWVGLSDGPYETWLTPDGERFTANFGEHTVVLTGIRGDTIYVNDPLVGERTTWTRDYFEQLWERLDRRALSL